MVDWPERRRDLRENAIAALDQQDLEGIAGELWQIANSDSLQPRVRLAHGGLLDWGGTSLATGTDHPPATEVTRRYNEPGGYRRPLALHQQDVELAIPRDENGRPQRFGDLNGEWLRRINDGGPAADLSRGINCTDVVLSVLDTWLHGRPRVAAPRTIDRFTLDDALRPLGGEPERGAAGSRPRPVATSNSLSSDRPGFARLEEVLGLHGHGSCAVLVQQWPNGDSHATTVHNQNGKIVYVDAQRPEAPIIGGPPFRRRPDAGPCSSTPRPCRSSSEPAESPGMSTPKATPRAHSNPITDLDSDDARPGTRRACRAWRRQRHRRRPRPGRGRPDPETASGSAPRRRPPPAPARPSPNAASQPQPATASPPPNWNADSPPTAGAAAPCTPSSGATEASPASTIAVCAPPFTPTSTACPSHPLPIRPHHCLGRKPANASPTTCAVYPTTPDSGRRRRRA